MISFSKYYGLKMTNTGLDAKHQFNGEHSIFCRFVFYTNELFKENMFLNYFFMEMCFF